MRNKDNYYKWYFSKNNIIEETIEDLDGEIWKDIEGYENLYQVSNKGRIKSLKRKGILFDRIIKTKPNNGGYQIIGLRKDKERKWFSLHSIVANTFNTVPLSVQKELQDNPNLQLQINHIDEDLNNNSSDNLEFCTNIYNANYGTRNERISNAIKEIRKIKYWNNKKHSKFN